MIEPRSEAIRQLRRSLVRIDAADGTIGSGFWIGPDLVLTCAHVAPRGQVEVVWQGNRLPGEVSEAAPAKAGHPDEPWPYPDLALITVPQATVHDCVWLSDQSIPIATPLFLLGHSSIYSADLKSHSANGSYAGPHGDDDELWRFTGDEIAPGMSGGPVLDLDRGAVCAVIKTSREVDSERGGLLVPLRGLRRLTEVNQAGLWRAHDRHHARGSWIGVRRGLATTRTNTLDAGEEAELLELMTHLESTPDLLSLYSDAVAPSTALPPEPINNPRQLCYQLADLLARPGQPHPLLRLVHRLTESERNPVQASLREWAVRVAGRRGEYEDLERWRRDLAGTRPREIERPSIIVQIKPTALDRHRFLLTVWVQEHGNRGMKVYCDDGQGRDLTGTRTLVAQLLRPLLKRLQGFAGVEFVVPEALFDEDFENLLVGRFSRLGRTNPVAIRDLERLSDDETWHSWHERWRRLHDGAGSAEWITCDDRSTSDEFDAGLRLRPEIALLGLAQQPRQFTEDALGVALYAGVPAAVWSRDTCPEHRSGEAADECSGDRFRQSVSRFLAISRLDELPDVIQQMRNAAAAGKEPSGANVVLLWDDPERRPEPDAPLIELA
ncbi:VMAP-C domain-containing protein [Paractinoplanes toevensis]|uniref:Trypsin-like peptidase domain-containing protein n=1 Tax=Paractinoplanes toevensis TaxID=571911 RepID=A0A919TCQ7_9ACTN|nr:trypsin-like peptidase domain-containing protein [Actinoplanes toevensis]GIM92005.1 hypothetical protein Ato02nite_037980 [Actinoplanes toevensis]